MYRYYSTVINFNKSSLTFTFLKMWSPLCITGTTLFSKPNCFITIITHYTACVTASIAVYYYLSIGYDLLLIAEFYISKVQNFKSAATINMRMAVKLCMYSMLSLLYLVYDNPHN